MQRKIAAFDFDGTLTRRDTLLAFIQHTKGRYALWCGFLLHLPLLLLMKLHLYSNERAKERLFTFFFRGTSYELFCSWCETFIHEIQAIERTDIVKKLHKHLHAGHTVYIVSASITEWILPWAKLQGTLQVLATRIEVDSSGILTGRFLGKNCYGSEKVDRLVQVEPKRTSYYLYAYGDSQGDTELLAYADESYKV